MSDEIEALPDVGNLHHAAPGLRILWILYHCDEQVFLVFAKGDVRRAIPGRDLKDMQQLALGRDLQNLAAEPLGHIHVALAIDLHAVGAEPLGLVLVFYEKIEQRKIGAMAQRAVVVDREFQDAVPYGFADVESLLVG
jgi:hypothetical protein